MSIPELQCGGQSVLQILRYVLKILNVIYILVPIFLILLITIDFVRAVMSKEEEMKKYLNLTIKRILYTLALYLVKPVTIMSQNILGDTGINIAECINIARSNDDLEKYNYSIVLYDGYIPKKETVDIKTKTYVPGTSSKKENITVDDFIESLENMSKQVEAESGKWTYTVKGQTESLTFDGAKKNNKKYTSCAKLVSWALRDIGVYSTDDPKYSKTRFYKCYKSCNYQNTVKKGGNVDKMIQPYLEKIDFSSSEMDVKKLIKQNKLKKGDIVLWYNQQHTSVYAGNNIWYDAGWRCGDHGYPSGNVYHFKTFKTTTDYYTTDKCNAGRKYKVWGVYRWK